MRVILTVVGIVTLLTLLSTITHATEIPVKIIQIHDGDTVTVIYHDLPLKVRLRHIDAPEKHQARGLDAAEALKKLCINQAAKLNIATQDRYGRYVAVIMVSGKDINKEMVRQGWAWWYTSYSTDRDYKDLEKSAQKNRVGVWADIHPTPPWDFRVQ